MQKESYLYQKLQNKIVQCQTCYHFCVLKLNEKGKCKMRQNIAGDLMVLNYGQAVGLAIDPIEKKPICHFLPNTFTLSFGTLGCNFFCLHCQNYFMSQIVGSKHPVDVLNGLDLSLRDRQYSLIENILPEQMVALALAKKLPSISYTYNEPTIFLEYALDTMKLAHEKELKNIWVSNGFMSEETLNLIAPYLDAINIDLKSFSEKFYQEICGAHLQPVLDNLIKIKKSGIHLEITTLIIPTKNDSEAELKQVAEFIVKNLGAETPWHVSAFYPTYKLNNLPPTSREKILEAKKIGQNAGLKWAHTGNI